MKTIDMKTIEKEIRLIENLNKLSKDQLIHIAEVFARELLNIGKNQCLDCEIINNIINK